MKTFTSTAIFAASLLCVLPANAQNISYPDTVLELFTSQGCSSCPPANAFVREIAASDGSVLTLSYSVEYWDYLGWKDTLGNPAFSKRQRDYGQHFQGQVYTPQMVLNGAAHSARLQSADVKRHRLGTGKPELSLRETPTGAFVITISGKAKDPVLSAVTFSPGTHSVDVKAGENRGRAIKLANVVTGIALLSINQGGAAQLILQDAKQNTAVILQCGNGGPILSAAVISSKSP